MGNMESSYIMPLDVDVNVVTMKADDRTIQRVKILPSRKKQSTTKGSRRG
jgi:hypothetical protein